MIGKVIGIKEQDFMGNTGPVKRQIFYLLVPGQDFQGHKGAEAAHDLIRNGPPPRHQIGEEMEVEYNEKGKLLIMPSAYLQHNAQAPSTVSPPQQTATTTNTESTAQTLPRKAASA